MGHKKRDRGNGIPATQAKKESGPWVVWRPTNVDAFRVSEEREAPAKPFERILRTWDKDEAVDLRKSANGDLKRRAREEAKSMRPTIQRFDPRPQAPVQIPRPFPGLSVDDVARGMSRASKIGFTVEEVADSVGKVKEADRVLSVTGAPRTSGIWLFAGFALAVAGFAAAGYLIFG